MAQTMVLRGGSELERVLKGLPRALSDKALATSLRAGAKPIAEEARRRVRKRTGALAKSIVVRRSTQRQKKRGSGNVIIAIRQPAGRRAHFEEFGTRRQTAHPFFRPALDVKAREAIKIIGERLFLEVTKSAGRLTGRFKTSGVRRR